MVLISFLLLQHFLHVETEVSASWFITQFLTHPSYHYWLNHHYFKKYCTNRFSPIPRIHYFWDPDSELLPSEGSWNSKGWNGPQSEANPFQFSICWPCSSVQYSDSQNSESQLLGWLKAPSSLALNTTRDGASKISLLLFWRHTTEKLIKTKII